MSKTNDWTTPIDFYKRLDALFHFQLDVCASPENHKCACYFTAQDDGLAQDWHPYKSVWMNPPYGRAIGKWMKKAYEESNKGCVVVCLVPARVDTRWWHEWVKSKAQVTFVRGRLKFGNSAHGAPFPSAVVVYGLDLERLLNGSNSVGF